MGLAKGEDSPQAVLSARPRPNPSISVSYSTRAQGPRAKANSRANQTSRQWYQLQAQEPVRLPGNAHPTHLEPFEESLDLRAAKSCDIKNELRTVWIDIFVLWVINSFGFFGSHVVFVGDSAREIFPYVVTFFVCRNAKQISLKSQMK